MSEVITELIQPFSYAHKGDTQDATFITLLPPTFKQIDKIAPLKQAFVTAISDVSAGEQVAAVDTDDAASEDDITGPQIMALMYRSTCDMTKVFLHAQELFKSGAALVDGEVKLTTPLMEKMAVNDFERLVGDYIANFIAPSLMDGL